MSSILWWYVFLFLTKRITSNDVLGCNARCTCNDVSSASKWIVHVNNQAELDDFINNATSFTDKTANRCIQLSLTGGKYTLDVVKIMQLKLGTGGGLMVVGVGVDGGVDINCTASTSNLNELRNTFRPISHVALIAFDGLIFNSCPVPIVIEEVSVVVIKNCVFR